MIESALGGCAGAPDRITSVHRVGHRDFPPLEPEARVTNLLYKLGHLCARWRFVVLPIWAALIVGVVVAAEAGGSETSDNVSLPGTGSQNASDLLSGRFPSQAYGNNPIVVATDTGKLTDSKYSNAIGKSVTSSRRRRTSALP